MKNLLIIGASGHAKVLVDIAEAMGTYSVLGFLDKDLSKDSEFYAYPVLGADGDLKGLNKSLNIDEIIIAVGDNSLRMKLAEKLQVLCPKLRFATLIHPFAQISPSAKIGLGTVVMPGAIINADVILGDHCIVNTRASVDHDCKISSFAHIAPAATLCGAVRVGKNSLIGAGATIIPNISVGESAIIGAGAVLVRNLASGRRACGVPAKEVVSHQFSDVREK